MTERGAVISNTGPLIALCAAGALDVLRALYGQVRVPEGVWDEIVAGGRTGVGVDHVRHADWIVRVQAPVHDEGLLLAELGRGEAEVIALASSGGAMLVLLDERRARRVATVAYGLVVKGTAGVLVAAKRAGIIDRVRPMLTSMREQGYYLSDRLIARACEEVGE